MHKNVHFKGRKIAYQVTGEGLPLVFLHGFLEEASMWKPLEKKLIKKHKIVLVDLPGHGKTECTEEIETMAEMAQAVKVICDAENIIKPLIFGHSMGGYVGLELAKICEIELVLIHSNFWADSTEKKNDRNRVVEIVKDNLTLFVNTAIPNLFSSKNKKKCQSHILVLIKEAMILKPEAIAAVTKGMRDRVNNSQVLENTKVSIIQGAEDPIIPKRMMIEQLKLVKNKTDYIEIKDCGHMGFIEKPGQFYNLIKRIIDKFALLKSNY